MIFDTIFVYSIILSISVFHNITIVIRKKVIDKKFKDKKLIPVLKELNLLLKIIL